MNYRALSLSATILVVFAIAVTVVTYTPEVVVTALAVLGFLAIFYALYRVLDKYMDTKAVENDVYNVYHTVNNKTKNEETDKPDIFNDEPYDSTPPTVAVK